MSLSGSQTGGDLQYCGFSHERGRRSFNEKAVEILTRPGGVDLLIFPNVREFLIVAVSAYFVN